MVFGSFISSIHRILCYIPNSGGNQLVLGSVCESKNIKTSPFAARAPAKRATIRPDRSGNRINFTFGKCFEMKLSRGVLTLSRLLASSTNIISAISSGGERFKTLYTVRINVLKCSLKNGTTTLTVGNSLKYLILAQLQPKMNHLEYPVDPNMDGKEKGWGKSVCLLFMSNILNRSIDRNVITEQSIETIQIE